MIELLNLFDYIVIFNKVDYFIEVSKLMIDICVGDIFKYCLLINVLIVIINNDFCFILFFNNNIEIINKICNFRFV